MMNLKKETSERNDLNNWAKLFLIENTNFFYESIEGCNQNNFNITTHLFDRANYTFYENKEEIIPSIKEFEGHDSIDRKLALASHLNISYNYVLYCYENNQIKLLDFTNKKHIKTINNIEKFSQFLQKIKGWRSNKTFREIDDLPIIDKELRKLKTPWPINIDCVIFTRNKPLAILEYQNADKTGVKNHSNNFYFLCGIKKIDKKTGITIYHDDIRRWLSQEILRVQSNLRLLVITWSNNDKSYKLKEIEKIVFPELDNNGVKNWEYAQKYKEALHRYAISKDEKILCGFKSYQLLFSSNIMKKETFNVLSYKNKTLPGIYYSYNEFFSSEEQDIALSLDNLIFNN